MKLRTRDAQILLDAILKKNAKMNRYEREFYFHILDICQQDYTDSLWLTLKQSDKLEAMYRKYC